MAALVDRERECIFVPGLHSKDCDFDRLPHRLEYDEEKVKGFYFEFKSETKRCLPSNFKKISSKISEEIFKKELSFYTGEKKVEDENLEIIYMYNFLKLTGAQCILRKEKEDEVTIEKILRLFPLMQMECTHFKEGFE